MAGTCKSLIYPCGDQTLTSAHHFDFPNCTMRIPTALVAGLHSLSLVTGSPLPHEASSETVATLDDGIVKGSTDEHGNSVFLGIPFAATTGGENRYVGRNHVKAPADNMEQMEGASRPQEAGQRRSVPCDKVWRNMPSSNYRDDVVATGRGLLESQHMDALPGAVYVEVSTPGTTGGASRATRT